MAAPIDRFHMQPPNIAPVQYERPETAEAFQDAPIPSEMSPITPKTPAVTPKLVESWQQTFSGLSSTKKTLFRLLGAASLGAAGAGALAKGLQEGDEKLLVTGSLTIMGAFASAMKAVLPSELPTQAMEAVINQLHQLADKYPTEERIFNAKDRFGDCLEFIFNKEIKEVPKNARNDENKKILIDHCKNTFKRFASMDETTSTQDLENIKTILRNNVQDFCESLQEVCARVESDKSDIQGEFFKNQKPLNSFQIRLDSGETHHKGRVVAFITFNGDDNQRIVYKPRDMRIDDLIAGNSENGLFQSINTLLASSQAKSPLNLPTYRFLNREEDGKRYGYTIFLSHEPKDYILNPKEMINYYCTIGAIQAIAQIFGLTDLHRQNILVHDKKPYPIDLEVSFDLTSLHGKTSTGLDNAVKEYGVPTIEGGTLPTPNRVDLKTANGKMFSLKEHYKTHKDDYIKAIGYGFRIIKETLSEKTSQETLERIIDNIPNNLTMRHVPLPTTELLGIMNGNVDDVTRRLALRLNESARAPYQIKRRIAEEQAAEDVFHVDVPRMTADMHGGVEYNEFPFLEASGADVKLILKERLTSISSMKIDSRFRESLDILPLR